MYKVIGIEKLDYVSKKGNSVKGHKIYLAYQSEKIEGVGVLDAFVSHTNDYVPEINDVVEIFYNRYGQVAKISIIE